MIIDHGADDAADDDCHDYDDDDEHGDHDDHDGVDGDCDDNPLRKIMIMLQRV